MFTTIATVLSDAAESYGDRVWLEVLDQPEGPLAHVWTFADYERATAAAAQVWLQLGVSPGDHVVIALPNRLEFLLAWHGLTRVGAVMVPLNMHFRSNEAAHVIGHSDSVAVLTTPAHGDEVIEDAIRSIPAVDQVVMVEDFAVAVAALLAQPGTQPGTAADASEPDGTAAILYTSGTTGAPKGCITTHRHFASRGRLLADCLRMGATSTKLVMLPLFHMNAQNSTMATIVSGGHMVLRNGFSASAFWPDVHEHQITHTHYLGSIIPILDARSDRLEAANPLQVLWGAGCSAGALTRLEARWSLRIIEVFGMTETGMDLCNDFDDRVPGSCGRPVGGKEIRLLDADGRDVGVDVTGEITIRRSPELTPGYLHDEAATDRLFVDGWLRTGDLARRDAQCNYSFVDRAKDVIRRSGENISSSEVEAVLRDHPLVVDAACVPMADPIRDEEIRAVVVIEQGKSLGPAELAEWCSARLAAYKVPRYIEFVDDLPRTPTGKVLKREIRENVSTARPHDGQLDWLPAQEVAHDVDNW